MTREEILEMEPSIHLNKLVQEKVFGTTQFYSMADDDDIWFNTGHGDVEGYSPVPDYSRSLSDSWEVVEKMQETNLVRVNAADGDYVCKIGGDLLCFKYIGKSAPEAICKAALLAVMDA